MRYPVKVELRMINELGIEFRRSLMWLEVRYEGCCQAVVSDVKDAVTSQGIEWPPDAVACVVSAENMKWFVVRRLKDERYLVARAYFTPI